MYFTSKKDGPFSTIFWGIILFIIIVSLLDIEPGGLQLITYNSLLGYIFSALMIGFLLWIWFGTSYKVTDDAIIIRSGPFKSTIKIQEITSIRKIKSAFTAPALAMDRIEIMYRMYDVVQLSPKDKEQFIQLLLEINPSIKTSSNDD